MSRANAAFAEKVESLVTIDSKVAEMLFTINEFFRKLHQAHIRAMPSVSDAFTERALSLQCADGKWTAEFKTIEKGFFFWKRKKLKLVFEYTKMYGSEAIAVCSVVFDWEVFSRTEPRIWVQSDPRNVRDVCESLPALLEELYKFGNIEFALQQYELKTEQ